MSERPEEWRVWLKKAMERRATMDEVQLQILHWAEHFEKLETELAKAREDVKRLDKLLKLECSVIRRRPVGTIVIGDRVHIDSREAIDKLEEPE